MKSSEQRYMETLFPEGKSLPANSLTPCLVWKGERSDVLFLIKAAEPFLAGFHEAGSLTEPEIGMAVHWEQPSENRPADLVLRLDMHSDGESAVFEAVLSGEEPGKQAAIGRALLQADRFGLFIAGNDFTFCAFQAYSWDSTTDLKLRRILLEAAAKGT